MAMRAGEEQKIAWAFTEDGTWLLSPGLSCVGFQEKGVPDGRIWPLLKMQQSLHQTQTINLSGNIISLNLQIEIAGNGNQRSKHEGLAGAGRKVDVENGLASAENEEALHLPKHNHERHEEESIAKLKEQLLGGTPLLPFKRMLVTPSLRGNVLARVMQNYECNSSSMKKRKIGGVVNEHGISQPNEFRCNLDTGPSAREARTCTFVQLELYPVPEGIFQNTQTTKIYWGRTLVSPGP
ncbi:hypothetical protein EDB19DRAFT_1833980 [Suillus lakei]|nr:hypothetical protein EDB19DRAFT_1833980 [Suillus lakei]